MGFCAQNTGRYEYYSNKNQRLQTTWRPKGASGVQTTAAYPQIDLIRGNWAIFVAFTPQILLGIRRLSSFSSRFKWESKRKHPEQHSREWSSLLALISLSASHTFHLLVSKLAFACEFVRVKYLLYAEYRIFKIV